MKHWNTQNYTKGSKRYKKIILRQATQPEVKHWGLFTIITSWYPKLNWSHFCLPPAQSKAWLGWVAISCELGRFGEVIQTGPKAPAKQELVSPEILQLCGARLHKFQGSNATLSKKQKKRRDLYLRLQWFACPAIQRGLFFHQFKQFLQTTIQWSLVCSIGARTSNYKPAVDDASSNVVNVHPKFSPDWTKRNSKDLKHSREAWLQYSVSFDVVSLSWVTRNHWLLPHQAVGLGAPQTIIRCVSSWSL